MQHILLGLDALVDVISNTGVIHSSYMCPKLNLRVKFLIFETEALRRTFYALC